eukprot:TRINITY_DN68967_c0_g1_i1.p1 TRINITY_DN68967_c0_g1~~TRINITY_DN68967_c0_g1_i1.p1  ORF type:complete len:329 (-),score=44.37 TRINITY_DN68967_c0_g1_i1:45-1031(-)
MAHVSAPPPAKRRWKAGVLSVRTEASARALAVLPAPLHEQPLEEREAPYLEVAPEGTRAEVQAWCLQVLPPERRAPAARALRRAAHSALIGRAYEELNIFIAAGNAEKAQEWRIGIAAYERQYAVAVDQRQFLFRCRMHGRRLETNRMGAFMSDWLENIVDLTAEEMTAWKMRDLIAEAVDGESTCWIAWWRVEEMLSSIAKDKLKSWRQTLCNAGRLLHVDSWVRPVESWTNWSPIILVASPAHLVQRNALLETMRRLACPDKPAVPVDVLVGILREMHGWSRDMVVATCQDLEEDGLLLSMGPFAMRNSQESDRYVASMIIAAFSM